MHFGWHPKEELQAKQQSRCKVNLQQVVHEVNVKRVWCGQILSAPVVIFMK